MTILSGKVLLAVVCAVQFCFILVLILNKNHDECMDELAESNARLEEISALQNIREQEIAAEQVARMEAVNEMNADVCCACCKK